MIKENKSYRTINVEAQDRLFVLGGLGLHKRAVVQLPGETARKLKSWSVAHLGRASVRNRTLFFKVTGSIGLFSQDG